MEPAHLGEPEMAFGAEAAHAPGLGEAAPPVAGAGHADDYAAEDDAQYPVEDGQGLMAATQDLNAPAATDRADVEAPTTCVDVARPLAVHALSTPQASEFPQCAPALVPLCSDEADAAAAITSPRTLHVPATLGLPVSTPDPIAGDTTPEVSAPVAATLLSPAPSPQRDAR